MRFSDFFKHANRKQVGEVIEANWDPASGGILFTIRFLPSGRRVSGVCRAGLDPISGLFVSETDLKKKIPKLRGLPIYEHPTGGDPNTISTEAFSNLKIQLSLSNMHLSYQPVDRPLSANTFISRLFR